MSDTKEQPAGPLPQSAPSITSTSMYGESNPPPSQHPSEDLPPARSPGRNRLSALFGVPLNKAAHLVGSEGWWPTALPSECDKAARILHSFTSSVPAPHTAHGPKHVTGLTQKAISKIPPPVLHGARGLAVFNTLRVSPGNGSLAAGSGVVVARRPDGSWSPPSAFLVTTLGAGFSLGLDMYEVVCVLNTEEQVKAFTKARLSLGGEMSMALGPTGAGVNVEAAVSRTAQPVWSYMKSRGLWVGLQVDGTVMISRHDANHEFYGRRVSAADILFGDAQWPEGGKALLEVLRGVDGQLMSGHIVSETAPVVHREQAQGESQEVPPPAYSTEQVHNDKAEEGILDEKERLAKAGY